MAVLRAVAGRKTQAIVRKGGFSLARTFHRRVQGEDWARKVEDAIASATPERPFVRELWLTATFDPQAVDDTKPHTGWTLKRLLEWYGANISPKKKGHEQERKRLKVWQAHKLAVKKVSTVTTADFQSHVTERLARGRAASTVRLEMMLLRAVFRDSKITGLRNPAAGVVLPAPAAHRQRRLEDAHDEGDGEEKRLRDALAKDVRGADLTDLMDLALETGMRQSEILSLTAGQIRRVRGIRYIEQPDSKNGQPRRVTLSAKATQVFERRAEGLAADAKLFTITPNRLWKRWNEVRKAADVHGFKWHDLRHEALSRMAQKGLNIGELQAQSGHRSPGILLRYVNAKPADVAKKLG